MIYSWQTVNPWNLAEQVCRPTEYFDFGPVTVLPQDCSLEDFQKGPVIFGASGLLYPEIAPILQAAVNQKQHPMIAWGIGHNTHGGTKVEYPEWLSMFDLVGLRDYITPYLYVPCPSCLHKAFDVAYPPPCHKLVVYDQFDYPVGAEYKGAARENNNHPASEMDRIVAFLASGETIVTSSYHGAYWGMLLNRQVILWRPWSTKFYGFKVMPHAIDGETWTFTANPNSDTYYLKECRALNRVFAERVRLVISKDGA